MNKKKSLIIVIIFSIMFGILTYCFYEIMTPAFITVISILSAYGFLRGLVDFNTWLLIDDNNKPNNGYNGTTVYTPKEEEKKEEETTKENYELNDIIEEYKD